MDYEGKLFSIMGDGLSTLQCNNPPDYEVFYKVPLSFDTHIFLPEDTWWGQVITAFGAKLLANASWAGSTVCKLPDIEVESYGCSLERTTALGRYGKTPNVIIISMGTNDWLRGMRVYPRENDEDDAKNTEVFRVAYADIIKRIKKRFRYAEIWCMTLSRTKCASDPDFVFQDAPGGVHISEYCEAIRKCAAERGCRIIEMYENFEGYDTIDGIHASLDGMKTIANRVLDQIPEDFYF